MAHLYGSLAADWVEGGSPYGDSTPHDYRSRRGHPDSIPPEALQILERAFAENPYPSSREISLVANRTQLELDTIRIWFSGQSYRLSDRSDPTNATAPLHPPGPVSVQSDIQYTAGWLENKADHVVELGAAHGHPPVGLNAQHYLNSPNHSASTFPLDVATDAPIDAFSSQLDAPWFYGSRVSHQSASCSPSC
jgi:hypothetical protein